MIGGLIFLLFVVLIIAFIVWGIVAGRKMKRREKEYLKSLGAEEKVSLTHVDGLDFGETLCGLLLFPDKVRIERPSTNQMFEVSIENIFESKTEPVMKNTGFSLGKAALGEAVAGPLGAVVAGSSGKTKQDGLKRLLRIRFFAKDGDKKELVFLSYRGNEAVSFSKKLSAKILEFQKVEPGTVTQL